MESPQPHYFRYNIFGLHISSEFEINHPLEINCKLVDVIIKSGKVANHLTHSTASGARYEISENEFLLKVDGIAQYQVLQGKEIIVEPNEKAKQAEINLFLFGTVIGVVLYKLGKLPMHGSTIVKNNNAIMFTGFSGAGKSTLAAAFAQKNMGYLSDDVSAIQFTTNGLPIVYPGFQHIKLWQDSLLKIGQHPIGLEPVRDELLKFYLRENQQWVDQPKVLKQVYVLKPSICNSVSIKEIKGIEKFEALKINSYRHYFIKELGKSKNHFLQLAELVKHTRVCTITRPLKSFHLTELVNQIDEDMLQFNVMA